MPQGLTGFNDCPAGELDAELLSCCASRDWARRVAAGRPYPSTAALYEVADQAVTELDEDELAAALAGHPRIGARPGAGHAASSAREQARVAASSEETLQALDAGNREYEARFGHVYLVCADGRSGAELLAVLRQRLGNTPEVEQAVVRTELAKINRIRLARLIGAGE